MDLLTLDQMLSDAERLLRHGQLDEARPILASARQLAHDRDDRQGEAQVLMWQGDLEDRSGNPNIAREYLANARALYASQGEQHNQARVLMRLATLAKNQENLDECRTCLEAARQMYQSAGDRAGLARAEKRLGHLALRIGDRQAAMEAFKSAADHARQSFNLGLEVDALIQYSHLKGLAGDWDTAHQHLRRALDAARQVGDVLAEGVSLKNLGLARLHMGDQKGIDYLREAQHVFAHAGDLAKQAECLLLLAKAERNSHKSANARTQAARLYRQLGRFDLANKLITRAIQIRPRQTSTGRPSPGQTPKSSFADLA